ncbi:citramalate synthase [candidate division KSB1 bacterium]|nr:citramalate synthase [candidate division KSB1 bacterium]
MLTRNDLPQKLEIYDTTLRDGTQGEGIAFSVEDKLRIAKRLDQFGIDYIEGGWPGSNKKDEEFFKLAAAANWEHARIAAFGSTRHPKFPANTDPNLQALLESRAPVCTIFGKTWDLHVREALGISLTENLQLIRESIAYLKEQGRQVFYDAEHFFDGYRTNPDYAIQTLLTAWEAGAECLILCDTNGGTLTSNLVQIIQQVRKQLPARYGIHTHNDADLAVANTIAAVECGCEQVQGTVNGYGERCGNANLCSILPAFKYKLSGDLLPRLDLENLTALSRYVSEEANLPHRHDAPYVGQSAFAHKGGIHVSAIRKNSATYEHLTPEAVGNVQRILISDLSGQSNILAKAEKYGLDLQHLSPRAKEIVQKLKSLEHLGYQYEAAEGSFEILIKKLLRQFDCFFELDGFRVIIERRNGEPVSEATIKVTVNGQSEHTAAEGVGPVNALDHALRKALEKFYPALKNMRLTDYKVRVLDEKQATQAKVRVLIESADESDRWGTVGVSDNIIEASWQALVDSISYKLMKDQLKRTPAVPS